MSGSSDKGAMLGTVFTSPFVDLSSQHHHRSGLELCYHLAISTHCLLLCAVCTLVP